MDKIARHIETLLRRHDFVIVPDFGGFVSQHQPAKIKEDQINPPLAVVGFNPLMNISDGLLAIEISRAENKSFRESIQWMESEINRLKLQLKQDKKVVFGALGTLRWNDDDKIEFFPSESNTIFPSNYGMPILYYSKIAEEISGQQKTVTIAIPSRNKIARYAAVGIIVAGLMLSAPKLNDMKHSVASLNPVEFFKGHETRAMVANSNAVVGEMIVATSPTENQEVAPEEKKYHVIVGCMATQKMADKICNGLRNSNYPNATVLPRIKTYRIAIDSFVTETEAVSYMQNLRKTNPQFPDAWVLNY